MSDLTVTTLGTASQAPSVKRALNSSVYRLKGVSYLVDCGEGTQSQLTASGVRPSSIRAVLITHLHGDHCFGLPGMVCLLDGSHQTNDQLLSEANDTTELLSAMKKTKFENFVLEIYGPVGLRRYLRVSLQMSRSRFQCQYRVHEMVPTANQISHSQPSFEKWNPPDSSDFEIHPNEIVGRQILAETITEGSGVEYNTWTLFTDENGMKCTACELYHKVPSFGFIFIEPTVSGLLDKIKLEAFGLRNSPLCGKLARGQSVEVNGKVVEPKDVTRDDEPGRKVCILGDCNDSNPSVIPCGHADVILHESTLENSMVNIAIDHGHSTPTMAVDFAVECCAEKLILNHFSQRYRSENDEKYKADDSITDEILLTEGRARAAEHSYSTEFVDIARDLKVFNISRRKR